METTQKNICIGIDLCSDYSQVSYYDFESDEPASVEISGNVFVPTVVSKSIGKDEWFAGEDAEKSAKLGESVLVTGLLEKAIDKNPVTVDETSVMPIKLLGCFFEYLLMSVRSAAGADNILSVCVTLDDFNISVLNILVKAMESVGIERDKLAVASHDESFVYYAISQRVEMWANDNFLFDYGDNGLVVKRMYIINERGTRIAMVHTDDLRQSVTASLMESENSREFADTQLTQVARDLFDKKSVSTVYLTGKLFADGVDLPQFVKFICDRRRVFAGNNLYCKGACYEAMELVGRKPLKDVLLACGERITTGIEMKYSQRGRDKILRMVKPGINWYGADCSYEFIVDEMDEIEIFLSPVDGTEKQVVRISLEDFPKRPPRTTRIAISFSFTSDSRCHLMVKDMGFGEFFASSGRVINEELLL